VRPSTRKRVTSGFACIANDDQILFEHYQYRRSDGDRFISRSTAKSIAAMRIEIAISENTIKSVDDVAQTYVPGFKNTEYGKTPIGGTDRKIRTPSGPRVGRATGKSHGRARPVTTKCVGAGRYSPEAAIRRR
jgi:hypothetical protein